MYYLKRNLFLFILTITVVLLVVSCAQIVAPTGGLKDIIPPKVEKETPLNKSTSFNSKKITIRFDEYIQLKNIEEQLVISPPMDIKPLFEVSGKSIEILIRSELKPNTTYTINFGNSIVDNHEGAILSNYNYVFSTGASVDTLSIKGITQNAFTNIPEKGISVCLYTIDSFTDSTIYNHKPYYFTKSVESGSFIIENLPPQLFHLVAFKDDNKNLKYDNNELISFYDTIINTLDSNILKPLLVYKANSYSPGRLLDSIAKDIGRFQFAIYKHTQSNIKPLDTTPYYTWYNSGKENIDTLTLFNTNWKKDSVWFNYKTKIVDTSFYIKPRKTAKPIKFTSSILKTVELNDSFTIQFNQPFKSIITDTSKLLLLEDTIVIKPLFFYSRLKDYIKIYYPLKEKTNYNLSYKDSAFMDIYGNYNQKEKVLFVTKSIKDYSTLNITIIHPNDGYNYIIQLINPEETKLYKEFILTQTETYNLDYIIPAKYKVKIIRDINKNGKWDNGDYQGKIQPENVFYYTEILSLRAYWDLDQTIDLNKIVD